MSYCKQKRGTCLVDITKNCELYILLMTLRLTLKFWLTIGNAILKDGKQQIGKIKFDPNRDHAPLKYNKKINVPINRQWDSQTESWYRTIEHTKINMAVFWWRMMNLVFRLMKHFLWFVKTTDMFVQQQISFPLRLLRRIPLTMLLTIHNVTIVWDSYRKCHFYLFSYENYKEFSHEAFIIYLQ